MASLIVIVALEQKGYQDTWILQDVFLPVAAFVLVFSLTIVIVRDNRIVALLASSFLITLNAVPNLKYVLFYGTFDSVGHYGFIDRLILLGHVPRSGYYAQPYSEVPGMQVFMGMLTIVTGLSINNSIKLFSSIVFGTVPLMTYVATNGLFRKNLQKYVLIASGLPAVSYSYSLSGHMWGLALYFIFMCVLFRKALSNGSVSLTLIVLALGYSLIFSHPVTTIFLLVLLGVLAVFLQVYHSKTKTLTKSDGHSIVTILLVLAVSFMTLQVFEARFVFLTLVAAIESILLRESILAPIPARFFELPFLPQLRVFVLLYIKDALITVLSLFGLFVLFGRLRRGERKIFRCFYMPLLILIFATGSLLIFQLTSGFGQIGYERAIAYAMIFQPFFVGLVLWRLTQGKGHDLRKLPLVSLLLFSVISASLLQIFPYQPLMPSASVLSSHLPSNEYLFDFREVNTICMQSSVLFAEKYSSVNARIASDIVTRWQVYGFTSESFSDRHIYVSPLQPGNNRPWDIFLLHYSGQAGILNEKVEYRTQEKIMILRNAIGNLVYDNGGCFIIARIPLP